RAVADGLGLGLHDLHAHAEPDGGVAVEVHLEMAADLTLGQAHQADANFTARARAAVPQLRSLVTHLEPLPAELRDEDPRRLSRRLQGLRSRLTALADELAGPGATHNVVLHSVDGRLTATLHVTQPANTPLTDAHALAEAIADRLHRQQAGLD